MRVFVFPRCQKCDTRSGAGRSSSYCQPEPISVIETHKGPVTPMTETSATGNRSNSIISGQTKLVETALTRIPTILTNSGHAHCTTAYLKGSHFDPR